MQNVIFYFTSIFVLLFVVQGCKTPCDCTEMPQDFALKAIETDGYVFTWNAGTGRKAVTLAFKDLLNNTEFTQSFKQGENEPDQAKVKFAESNGFFKAGRYYEVKIKRDCAALNCEGDVESPYSAPLLLHYVPKTLTRFPMDIAPNSDPCAPTLVWEAAAQPADEYVIYRKLGNAANTAVVVEEYIVSGDLKTFQCPQADFKQVYTYSIVARTKTRAEYTEIGIGEVGNIPNITSCCVATVEDIIGVTSEQAILETIRDCSRNADACLSMTNYVSVNATVNDIRVQNVLIPAFDCRLTTYFRVMFLSPDMTKAYFTKPFEIPATSRTGDRFFFHSINPNQNITNYQMIIIPSLGDDNLLCQ